MKKLLLILLCLPMIGFGQGWETTIGVSPYADWGFSVQQTTDGGYIITGKSFSTIDYSSSDIILFKVNYDGLVQWSQTYGGLEYEEGNSVQQTTDGGYIITGNTESFGFGNKDVYLIKTDSQGDSLWTKTFGGTSYDDGESVQQTTDGGYIVCGGTVDGNAQRVYLIKTDGNGAEQWNQSFGGTSAYGYSVQQTTDGGYIITGNVAYNASNSNPLVYLIKTDDNGVELWNRVFGGFFGFDVGRSVDQTSDGGYIITGYTSSFGNGNDDIYLVKTDGNGDSLWTQTFGGTGYEQGYSVQQTTDNGYIIVGRQQEPFAADNKVYLIKTDAYGLKEWDKTYGGPYNDWGFSVQQTTDGGYIITGITQNSITAVHTDIYLIKTDANGNITSTFNIPTPNSNRELEKVIDVLGRETKEKTNEQLLYIYDDGTVEKRIVIE